MKEIVQPSMQDVLRFVAPGTPLREGLDNVLRAKTGGLIVVGYGPVMKEIVDGGFHINADFSPSYLYELAKMDGAIILSEDRQKILIANAQLNPDPSIKTRETGTRHRAAERVAIQTGHLVISISQRRHVITLYQGHFQYSLQDIGVLLAKANQAIQTLEKYRTILDQSLTNLGAMEFEEMVTLHDVASVLQHVQMVLRIRKEILRYVDELGSEGRLVDMQLRELVHDVENEALRLIQDYATEDRYRNPRPILEELSASDQGELMDVPSICRLLGYTPSGNVQDEPVFPRGYRLMHKIPRIPHMIVNNLVEYFGNFTRILLATIEELDEVDGIGEVRARAIKEGLHRIQEQVLIDRHL